MKKEAFKKLLDNYLKGTTTEEENSIVEHFYDYFLESDPDSIFEDERQKELVKSRIQKNVFRKTKKPKHTIFKVAAAITIIMTLSLLIQNTDLNLLKAQQLELATTEQQTKHIRLTDGSIITLNRNSVLEYPDTFHGSERVVTLKGEAYFEITPNPNKPFIVISNGVRTKVLGTKFNINSASKSVVVSLVEGSVDVSGLSYNTILVPNESIHFDLKKGIVKTSMFDPKIDLAWILGELNFKNATLSEITQVLEKRFGTTFLFEDDTLKNLKITGNFKNNSLNPILMTLHNTLGVQFKTLDSNQILIYKSSKMQHIN